MRHNPSEYRRWGKRALDIFLVLPIFLLSLPLVLLVAAAIALRMGRPILFRQQRPGLDGQPFVLLKFRTMNEGRDLEGRLLADEKRLSSTGRLLRRLSLDELPTLWNVLRGDMSLVGPRPLLMEYLPLYSKNQARRHSVRPGVTGWAQIHGRNALSWEQKFAHDLWYVQHLSLLTDLRILALTVAKVLKGEGIAAADHATMPPFRGSDD